MECATLVVVGGGVLTERTLLPHFLVLHTHFQLPAALSNHLVRVLGDWTLSVAFPRPIFSDKVARAQR